MTTSSRPGKTCVMCGEDCSDRPRVKDAGGRYYCKACHDRASTTQHARGETAPAPPDDFAMLDEAIAGAGESAGAGPRRQVGAGPLVRARPDTSGRPRMARGGGTMAASPIVVGLAALVLVPAIALIFGNLVTAGFFFFVILAALNGYWIGASKIAAALGGMIVAALLAVPLGTALEGIPGAILGSSGLVNRMLSIALVALVCAVAAGVGLHVAIKYLLLSKPAWKQHDKTVGLGIGLLEGTLLSLLLLWAILTLEPVATTSLAAARDDTTVRSNPVSQGIVALAEVTRESVVGRFAEAVNPLDEMRLITLFENGLVVLHDPQTREAFVNHEVIAGIRDRPSVQQALDLLREDPQMTRIIESDEGIGRDELREILSSRTILVILDDTRIVDDLSPLADELTRAIEESLDTTQPVRTVFAADPDAMAAVIVRLADPDPNIRRRAANTLGGMGPGAAGAVEALVALLGDRHPAVRAAAARALGRVGPPALAAIPDLTALRQDPDRAVRSAATDAIARIKPDDTP